MNPKHVSCRLRRALLQAALLKEVDKSRVQVSKKLVKVEKLSSGKVEIKFDDGYTDEVDLLVGADGIRSVRNQATCDYQSILTRTVRPVLRLPGAQNQVQRAICISHHHSQAHRGSH